MDGKNGRREEEKEDPPSIHPTAESLLFFPPYSSTAFKSKALRVEICSKKGYHNQRDLKAHKRPL